jgi:hypothetical protein
VSKRCAALAANFVDGAGGNGDAVHFDRRVEQSSPDVGRGKAHVGYARSDRGRGDELAGRRACKPGRLQVLDSEAGGGHGDTTGVSQRTVGGQIAGALNSKEDAAGFVAMQVIDDWAA